MSRRRDVKGARKACCNIETTGKPAQRQVQNCNATNIRDCYRLIAIPKYLKLYLFTLLKRAGVYRAVFQKFKMLPEIISMSSSKSVEV